MKQYTDDREYLLTSISGYTTEDAVWQMLLDIALEISEKQDFYTISPDDIRFKHEHFVISKSDGMFDAKAFDAPEVAKSCNGKSVCKEPSAVWSLGATAFYMLLGVEIFDGKGGQSQTEKTIIPIVSRQYASLPLSMLITKCIDYSPKNRPSLHELITIAKENMSGKTKSIRHTPRKLSRTQLGKGYVTSLINFWPEEMVKCIVALCILCVSSLVMAQNVKPSYEMHELASLVVSLRSIKNTSAIEKKLTHNKTWTLMNEIAIDKKGECTINDKVSTFGFNKIGTRIEVNRGSIITTNSRSLDGRDKKFNYSLIEITIRSGKTVSYDLPGRTGTQMFAIIPYKKSLAASFFPFNVTVNGNVVACDTEYSLDGILYIKTPFIGKDGEAKDKLALSLTNKSNINQAFVIINHNPRK